MDEQEAQVNKYIPKDLKRWLKENGCFIEFIRLVKCCGYKVSDLTYRHLNSEGYLEYGIKKWLKSPIESRYVQKKGSSNTIRYITFLSDLGLNWR